MLRRTALRLALAALAVPAFALAACGGDDDDTGGGAAADLVTANVSCKDLNVAAPARIKSAGKFVVASDLSYAPMEFVKPGSNEAIGADIDLARCIAEAWGVTLEVQNTSFDAIIPALTSKKADVIMSSMSVTDERKQQVDFVEYLVAGSGILVKKGNPKNIKSLADLCGKKVAIQVGTVQIDEAEEQNAKCAQKIQVTTFEQNTDTITAVSSGRADAALMDYPVAAYGARQVKGTEVVGEQYNTGPYGIAVRKDDTEVRTAIQAALAAMKEKGKYEAILKYWGLEAGALK
ncbi:ABC transporter substrate-binding protein [Tepidiforma bonchosmolovskayae]|uniref:ABC transporter substrate-binding protein n=1 Tax=Tepidiforma bonchosmolovskayae TaxID=2601677 RepID=A0ABX6C2R6_9CHLR|nr:ABC transporter substrate-binding protein [Tepidiforma bonchosmolovskayae]QFG03571.1 ABC transporter substrate-binding protein [Tepidiforma bonchosmolovskayae]